MNYYSVIIKAQQYSTLVVLVVIHGTKGISNTLTIHRKSFVHAMLFNYTFFSMLSVASETQALMVQTWMIRHQVLLNCQ